MKKLYLDANVVLDYLLRRVPFDLAPKQLLAAAEWGRVELLVSSLTFTTVHYVAAKQVGRVDATSGLTNLFKIVTVAAVDERAIGQALQADLPDFEDAVQLFAALAAGADAIVTRDAKGFRTEQAVVLDPLEALALL